MTAGHGLCAHEVSFAAGDKRILDRVSVCVEPGELVAVVGPNGAGKSTLLKLLAGDLAPQAGEIVLNAKPLRGWNAAERALQRAVLPQSPSLAFAFRAWDVVELGRHPHQGRASATEHHDAVHGAMDAADVARFAARDWRSLSGGEAHRTHFARALAQLWAPLADGRARFLLLDEPTASLDLFHQHAILARAYGIAEAGAGVLAVLHDLNLASAYADRIIVLSEGCVAAEGTPSAALTGDVVTKVWRVPCEIASDAATGRPVVAVRRATTPPFAARLAAE